MADVDAELERVGGDDAQHLSLAEPFSTARRRVGR